MIPSASAILPFESWISAEDQGNPTNVVVGTGNALATSWSGIHAEQPLGKLYFTWLSLHQESEHLAPFSITVSDAKALDLVVPPSLLVLADEVFE